MSLSVAWQSGPIGDPWSDLTPYLRSITADSSERAEEGATGMWQIVLDDPTGALDLRGHRLVVLYETDVSTATNRAVGLGYIQDITFERDDLIEGIGSGGRRLTLEVADLNTILQRRVLRDNDDADRPAETDVARIQWLMGSTVLPLVTDTSLLNTDDPVAMDAADYGQQTAQSVLDDLMEASGKNAFLWYTHAGAPPSQPTIGIFYDFAGSDAYSSTIRITNDADDVDADPASPAVEGAPTFVVGDAKLHRTWERVRSTVVMPYKNGWTSATRAATVTEYAVIETVMPAPNVSTHAKAKARATRLVNSLATPEDRLTIVFHVRRAYVNHLRVGQRFRVKFAHLDNEGYADDYVYVRALDRRVAEGPGLGFYTVTVVASGEVSDVLPSANTYGVLFMAKGPTNGDPLYFAATGDAPPPGYPTRPTTGLIEALPQATTSPYHPGWSYPGWKVTGTGTVDVTFAASTAGVIMVAPASHTVTYAILLNGLVVASEVVMEEQETGFRFVSNDATVSISALDVVPDDEITALVTCFPPMAGALIVPAGVGRADERLEITGGTLS